VSHFPLLFKFNFIYTFVFSQLIVGNKKTRNGLLSSLPTLSKKPHTSVTVGDAHLYLYAADLTEAKHIAIYNHKVIIFKIVKQQTIWMNLRYFIYTSNMTMTKKNTKSTDQWQMECCYAANYFSLLKHPTAL
jgi:hypothetical protein